ATVRQRYCQVGSQHKLDALTRVLEVEDADAILIFVRTKIAATELAERLEARGYPSAALHGDMTQALREKTIEQLRGGNLDIVVATDVAARGLDVQRISHVINYDIPYDTEAYIHRIGRTGRAGRAGDAILFIAPRELRLLRAIEKATRQPIERMPLPTPEAITGHRLAQFKQQMCEVFNTQDLGFFQELIAEVEREQEMNAHDIAAALTYLAQRERPFQFEDAIPKDAEKERERPPGRPVREGRIRGERSSRDSARDSADFDKIRYRIDVGREHGATPQNIMGAIANEAGIEGRYIGRIEIHDDYSTVDLPDGMPLEIFQHLKRVRVRQQMLNIRRFDGVEPERRRPGRPKVERLSGNREQPVERKPMRRRPAQPSVDS
ncbi:MAG TPA: ATP-dependent RNA helicase, partial [Gammaproteobacteria bacterium]|nr:ATP-dependent RNA helicase [Gammaproteobacteria bacterium]